MRRLLVLIVAILCVTAYAQLKSVSGYAPDRGIEVESPKAWDDWTASLTPEQFERLSRHKGGISTHPAMAIDAFGIDYPPILHLPLATFHRELVDYPNDVNMRLIEIFNIELISPQHRVDWPRAGTLRVELSNDGRYVHIDVPMDMRERGTYYVSHPQTLLSELIEATNEVGQFPKMQFPAFEGFVLNDETIENMPPLGAPITFNFRFGAVRVDTGFQWAGRPQGPINGGVEFLK